MTGALADLRDAIQQIVHEALIKATGDQFDIDCDQDAEKAIVFGLSKSDQANRPKFNVTIVVGEANVR